MIEKGKQWGEASVVPRDVIITDSDAQLATSSRAAIYAVRGGDLFRTLGEPAVLHVDTPCLMVHVDALQCAMTTAGTSREVLAVSSIVFGTWWRGAWTAITNAEWMGNMNIAPRSHPNDGRCELLEFSSTMPIRQRVLARKKMNTGTHIPHPHITTRSARSFSFDFPSTIDIRIDGIKYSDVSQLSVNVLPDYWRIVL